MNLEKDICFKGYMLLLVKSATLLSHPYICIPVRIEGLSVTVYIGYNLFLP